MKGGRFTCREVLLIEEEEGNKRLGGRTAKQQQTHSSPHKGKDAQRERREKRGERDDDQWREEGMRERVTRVVTRRVNRERERGERRDKRAASYGQILPPLSLTA